MLWLWQRFWVPGRIFFWIFVVPYKISHLCDNKNTFWLKIYPYFLSQITIYNFPIWPGSPCRYTIRQMVSGWLVLLDRMALNIDQKVTSSIVAKARQGFTTRNGYNSCNGPLCYVCFHQMDGWRQRQANRHSIRVDTLIQF